MNKKIREMLQDVRNTLGSRGFKIFMAALVVLALAVPTFAQTAVPLVVPTNEIFTQTNSWMTTFAPVVAIGVGIAVALAILNFIGKQILAAFR